MTWLRSSLCGSGRARTVRRDPGLVADGDDIRVASTTGSQRTAHRAEERLLTEIDFVDARADLGDDALVPAAWKLLLDVHFLSRADLLIDLDAQFSELFLSTARQDALLDRQGGLPPLGVVQGSVLPTVVAHDLGLAVGSDLFALLAQCYLTPA
jgi:hypothetical protein